MWIHTQSVRPHNPQEFPLHQLPLISVRTCSLIHYRCIFLPQCVPIFVWAHTFPPHPAWRTLRSGTSSACFLFSEELISLCLYFSSRSVSCEFVSYSIAPPGGNGEHSAFSTKWAKGSAPPPSGGNRNVTRRAKPALPAQPAPPRPGTHICPDSTTTHPARVRNRHASLPPLAPCSPAVLAAAGQSPVQTGGRRPFGGVPAGPPDPRRGRGRPGPTEVPHMARRRPVEGQPLVYPKSLSKLPLPLTQEATRKAVSILMTSL